ncbi:hypothetical protein D3C78_783660 [compost metagenome]
MALLRRLDNTCLKRSGSIQTSQWVLESISSCKSKPFCKDRLSNTSTTDSINSRRLARFGDKLKRPDSMRAMSRMSPINPNRLLADEYAISMLA